MHTESQNKDDKGLERNQPIEIWGLSLPCQEFNGERFYLYNGERYYSKGRRRLHRVVWEYFNGEIPKGYHIHHKDKNSANNRIENLELIKREKHLSEHSKSVPMDTKVARMDHARTYANEWHRSEEGRAWHVKHGIEVAKHIQFKDFTCLVCGKGFKSKKAGSKFCCNNCKSKYRRMQGVDNVKRTCVYCGKEFIVDKYSKTQCCSDSCAAKYRWQKRR